VGVRGRKSCARSITLLSAYFISNGRGVATRLAAAWRGARHARCASLNVHTHMAALTHLLTLALSLLGLHAHHLPPSLHAILVFPLRMACLLLPPAAAMLSVRPLPRTALLCRLMRTLPAFLLPASCHAALSSVANSACLPLAGADARQITWAWHSTAKTSPELPPLTPPLAKHLEEQRRGHAAVTRRTRQSRMAREHRVTPRVLARRLRNIDARILGLRMINARRKTRRKMDKRMTPRKKKEEAWKGGPSDQRAASGGRRNNSAAGGSRACGHQTPQALNGVWLALSRIMA